MKPTEKIAKAAPFVAGIVATAAAILLVVLLLLAEIGVIFPRQIILSIETSDNTKIYDETPLKGTFTITGGELAPGHEIDILTQTSITMIGTAENEIDFIITDETGADVTNRYKICLEPGTLTVKPVTLTVWTGSAKKAYDGEPLSKNSFSHISGKLFAGHSIIATGYTTFDGVGKTPNTMTFVVQDENGGDVTHLYDLNVVEGTLEVIGFPLIISTGSATKIYDGKPLSSDEYEIVKGSLEKGHTLTLLGGTSFEGVGEVNNSLNFVIRDANGNDVTNLYKITYDYGRLIVTPRQIAIKMGSITKKYTGSPVYKDTYEIISGSLCNGHTLTVVGKRLTEVGSTYNDMVSYTITAIMADGSKLDVSHCYKVFYDPGTITVLAP